LLIQTSVGRAAETKPDDDPGSRKREARPKPGQATLVPTVLVSSLIAMGRYRPQNNLPA